MSRFPLFILHPSAFILLAGRARQLADQVADVAPVRAAPVGLIGRDGLLRHPGLAELRANELEHLIFPAASPGDAQHPDDQLLGPAPVRLVRDRHSALPACAAGWPRRLRFFGLLALHPNPPAPPRPFGKPENTYHFY